MRQWVLQSEKCKLKSDFYCVLLCTHSQQAIPVLILHLSHVSSLGHTNCHMAVNCGTLMTHLKLQLHTNKQQRHHHQNQHACQTNTTDYTDLYFTRMDQKHSHRDPMHKSHSKILRVHPTASYKIQAHINRLTENKVKSHTPLSSFYRSKTREGEGGRTLPLLPTHRHHGAALEDITPRGSPVRCNRQPVNKCNNDDNHHLDHLHHHGDGLESVLHH